MKSRWIVGLILAASRLLHSPAAMAAQGDKIVRTKSLNGLPVVNVFAPLVGCENLGSLDVLARRVGAGSSLFLVRGLLDNTVNFLLSLLGLATIEPDFPVADSRRADWGNDQATGRARHAASISSGTACP